MWEEPPRLSRDGEAERLRHRAKRATDVVSRFQELNNNRREPSAAGGPLSRRDRSQSSGPFANGRHSGAPVRAPRPPWLTCPSQTSTHKSVWYPTKTL